MKCPNDQTVLAITERGGIEIDYCPTCRGVWLDRGELDKLISSGENPPAMNRQPHDNSPRIENRSQSYSHDSNHHNRKHRKESFLGDLFDF
jgi:Zn-finger nucleic acid-binding protein